MFFIEAFDVVAVDQGWFIIKLGKVSLAIHELDPAHDSIPDAAVSSSPLSSTSMVTIYCKVFFIFLLHDLFRHCAKDKADSGLE